MICVRRKVTDFLAVILLVIGGLQIVGFIGGLDSIRALGKLTAASPLPLVFSHFRGLETFSSHFEIVVSRENVTEQRIPITPLLYGELVGPYNLRNVYGAAISYGPVLYMPEEQRLLQSVLRSSLCPGGTLWNLVNSKIRLNISDTLSVVVTPHSYYAGEAQYAPQFILSPECLR